MEIRQEKRVKMIMVKKCFTNVDKLECWMLFHDGL
jgi:hypothetical protein